LVWVVPSSRDDFFRHAQGDQEPRGTELMGRGRSRFVERNPARGQLAARLF
jgi:hypothetical protein